MKSNSNHGHRPRRSSSRSQRPLLSPHDGTLDDTAPVLLSQTRSQELSVAESIAIPPDQNSLSDGDTKQTTAGNVSDDENGSAATASATPAWPQSVMYLVLGCALLTSLSFGVTQVPLLYVFRLMTCDAYYKDHRSQTDSLETAPTSSLSRLFMTTLFSSVSNVETNSYDRCSLHSIESSTALSISLLAVSNTVFGLLNLFLTGALIKRIGVKPTLLIQVFFPAIRLLVQNVGVEVWGYTGILIIQCSQIFSMIGGPSGYLLVLNTFITEVVEYEGRTAALGRLTGCMMLGSATGFLLGGIVADAFGIKAPFRLTLALFLTTCAYVATFLPHIPPAGTTLSADSTDSNGGSRKSKSVLDTLFGPLFVFAPKKFIGLDGVIRTEYGAFLLAWGVFLGILATGYLPTLLQLYATDVFGFGTKQNGWLIFIYSTLRGVFLTFAFPKLIALGREYTIRKQDDSSSTPEIAVEEARLPDERQPLLADPDSTGNKALSINDSSESEDRSPSHQTQDETFTFDLTYTRFSLLLDGLLTLLCSLVRQPNQMYLVAVILPFAAGTGSAAKGTVLQMVGRSASSSERTDALAGVSLVENMARLSTTFVFGVVFAGFANIGRTELVFTVNAAVALIGFGVLLFAHFPRDGSVGLADRLEEAEAPCEDDDTEQTRINEQR